MAGGHVTAPTPERVFVASSDRPPVLVDIAAMRQALAGFADAFARFAEQVRAAWEKIAATVRGMLAGLRAAGITPWHLDPKHHPMPRSVRLERRRRRRELRAYGRRARTTRDRVVA